MTDACSCPPVFLVQSKPDPDGSVVATCQKCGVDQITPPGPKTSVRDSPEHEALCQRCGIACHAAVGLLDGRQVVVEHLACPFLEQEVDGGLWSCTVYTERFQQAPWCHHARVAAPLGLLREGCLYVSDSNGKGKQRVSSEEYDRLWPEIAEALLAVPQVNLHFTWPKFFAEARKREPEYKWHLKKTALGTAGKAVRKLTARGRLKRRLRA